MERSILYHAADMQKRDPETRFFSHEIFWTNVRFMSDENGAAQGKYPALNSFRRGCCDSMNQGHEKPQKIGTILDEVLSQQGYLTICKEYAVARKWPDIVGPAFAAVSTCEKIENGILYVKIKTASWRQEAVYLKDPIVTKIQKEFGCPTIKDIVFY